MLGLDSLSWGPWLLLVVIITTMMNDDEQCSFHVRDEETEAQRGAVAFPGPQSPQAEGLGFRPRIGGPQSLPACWCSVHFQAPGRC